MLNEFVYFMSGAARATTDEEKRKIFALETKKNKLQFSVFSLSCYTFSLFEASDSKKNYGIFSL